jgi:hypothetical protein
MKSIILKPHELANIDRLTCIVRPMKKQPIEVWNKEGDIGMYDDGRIAMRFGNTIVGVKPPFPPGETAFVKEAFQIFHPYHDYETGYIDDIKVPCKVPKDSDGGYWDVAYRINDDNADSVEERWCSYRSPVSMPQWASRYHITFVDVEAKQLKDLTNEEIRGNCIKPDMVDSGGQTPWGNWIEVPDYGHPFLEAYNIEPYTWLWLWKVEVKKV